MSLSRLQEYLEDPFLASLYGAIRKAGPLRSISLDLTHRCNLRCAGCYFFFEGMDQHEAPEDEAVFDAFIERERQRGTNFVTVVGGEPALELGRLRKLYKNFKISVATNGLIKIPYEGFENLPIGVAVWGDHDTDTRLRAAGKSNVFARSLNNYRNDERAFFYYTVTPGNAGEIESVVEQCVENGNKVLFNFYSDLAELGGVFDHRHGFDAVSDAINRMIERYPEHILISSYVGNIVSTGELYGQRWGYDVCTSVSVDLEVNASRLKNGNPYNPHFKAYNADLTTWRRCCTGIDRDCSSCFDVWQHFSWIILNLKKHLASKEEFTNWLTTMYLFYLINRIVDYRSGIAHLPEIRERTQPHYAHLTLHL